MKNKIAIHDRLNNLIEQGEDIGYDSYKETLIRILTENTEARGINVKLKLESYRLDRPGPKEIEWVEIPDEKAKERNYEPICCYCSVDTLWPDCLDFCQVSPKRQKDKDS